MNRIIIKNYYIFLVLIFMLGCNQYSTSSKNKLYLKKMKELDQFEHIDDFKWMNRVLVIKNKNQKLLFEQIKNNKTKLYDRDIVIIILNDKNAYIKNKVLSKIFYKSLKKKMKDLDDVYETILLGRDGKIKKIYPKNIDLDIIFADIDKMPMRINEMKKNN